jgi:hypothetical protein
MLSRHLMAHIFHLLAHIHHLLAHLVLLLHGGVPAHHLLAHGPHTLAHIHHLRTHALALHHLWAHPLALLHHLPPHAWTRLCRRRCLRGGGRCAGLLLSPGRLDYGHSANKGPASGGEPGLDDRFHINLLL